MIQLGGAIIAGIGIIVVWPFIGMAIGAFMGWRIERVSTDLGARIGLASGFLSMGFVVAFFWLLNALSLPLPPYNLRMWMIMGLPLAGLLSPIIILKAISGRRR